MVTVEDLALRLKATIERATQEVVLRNPHASDALLQAEALRYLWRILAVGQVLEVEYHDPAYPSFFKYLSPWLNWGYPNPDGVYPTAAVHGDYCYRVYGQRGTSRLFDVEVYEGNLNDFSKFRSFGGQRDIRGGKSEISFAADGSFDFILSREEQPGNWIPLPEGYGYVTVRQWYYDYEEELPGQLFIERLGATYPRPPMSADDLAAAFDRLIQFVETVPAAIAQVVGKTLAADPGTVQFPPITMASELGDMGFRHQVYGQGHFECGPDEAVILEVDLPPAQYWMFCLMSPFWESYDWMGRQISINGGQAVIDDDGRFRAVIAHRDPGVPNWLDASGHTSGLVGGRYNWTEAVPIPTLTTVPFDKVREVLPASTPTITPAERSEVLRRRFLSQQRRSVAW